MIIDTIYKLNTFSSENKNLVTLLHMPNFFECRREQTTSSGKLCFVFNYSNLINGMSLLFVGLATKLGK